MTTLSSIRNSAIEDAGSGGLTVYATKENLPTTNLTEGDQAYVSNNRRLYVSNGSGWYNVALVNAAPSLTVSPSGAIELSKEGAVTTITLTATDSDNAVDGITFSVDSDGSFAGLGTISQDSSVFTITPLSEDSATTTSSTLTFKASDGINFGSGDTALSLTFSIENSNYTTLLVQADTAGADNQVDASTNNLSITEYGDVTSTAFTPYHPGGYSTYFDGSGDYLQTSSPAIPASGDFTIETWVYVEDTSVRREILSQYLGGSPSQEGRLSLYVNSGAFSFFIGSTLGNVSLVGPTVVTNTWYHLAVVRNSNNFYFYVDGVLVASDTGGKNITIYTGSYNTSIGSFYNGGWVNSMKGYIADSRVVSDAVYTSAFTPPTAPLIAIANTELLTCHLPYIADGSTNDHTLSTGGTPSTERFVPYDYEDPYVRADHGGSVHFDGNGDYMDVTTSTAADFGTGDFTVEVWWYPTTPTQNGVLWGGFTNATNTSNNVCEFYLGLSTGWLRPHVNTNFNGTWTTRISTTEFCKDKTWNHVAYVRNGNVGNIYINGKKGPDNAIDATAEFNNPFNSLRVFRSWQTTTSYGKGYLADLRIVKGTAVYTADFTPPTAPLTAISNTELLTMTNKKNIWDAAGANELITVGGTATASNTQRKFTSSSAIALDGNSDYLQFPAVDAFNFGTSDFTMETWVYPTTTGNNYPSFFSSVTGWNAGASGSRFDNTGRAGKYTFHLNGASPGDPFLESANTFSHDTWTHYALAREGNTFRMFVNGNLEASGTFTGSYNAAYGGLRLGWAGWDGGNGYFAGYLQNTRFTKGLARYTSNFTPPTSEFSG